MRGTRIVVAAGLALSLAALSGCALFSKRSASGHPVTWTQTDSTLPSGSPSAPEPGPTATTPAGTPSSAGPHTTKPAAPPPPTVASEGHCAGFTGTNVSKSTVLRDLTAASKVNEWAGLDPAFLPVEMKGVRPVVTIPLKLLKAIAAQESGWRSACNGTDGLGFGTMQITAPTQDWMNQKFGESFDRMTPRGNIDIAVAELEWLTVHFGIVYFHKSFNLSTNTQLFDAVVASYNVGYAAVDVGGAIHIGPIGSGYVSSVRGLMSSTSPVQSSWGH